MTISIRTLGYSDLPQVIDSGKRFLVGSGQRLGARHAYQQRGDQPGPAGDGDQVEVA